jgi:predicted HD phosphohydrolase
MSSQTVSFTSMAEATKEDMLLYMGDFDDEAEALPKRIMEALRALENYKGALQVTRLEHSLQSATRAHRDGKDEDYVVAALIHDIGDTLAPYSHGELVAAVMRPFLDERLCTIVRLHPVFQMYYYAHLIGEDRNVRDRYRDNPYYADVVEFCELYDQNCFDPDYESLPLEFFEPMVRRVFREPRYVWQ